MKIAAILIYIGGHHGGNNLTPEERLFARWAFGIIFSIAIGAALWTYVSWKKKQKGR